MAKKRITRRNLQLRIEKINEPLWELDPTEAGFGEKEMIESDVWDEILHDSYNDLESKPRQIIEFYEKRTTYWLDVKAVDFGFDGRRGLFRIRRMLRKWLAE